MSYRGSPGEYQRPLVGVLTKRLREPRRHVQVLFGPRQSGKTTLARQAMARLAGPAHYATADEPGLPGTSWIEAQWEVARQLVAPGEGGSALLVLDEIQKIPGWSGVVKHLWDADTRERRAVKVVVLGSAPLLVQRGLSETLAGRFEVIRVPHWSFQEMSEAFGWDLDHYLFFGGYPGAASLTSDETRWRSHILDSLIETTISRDVLLLSRVDKPALLRQLFRLGCEYSGQILSHQKMLGQLQDAGNATTLAHYLELLNGAGMLCGLQKYSGRNVRQRGSIPKLLVHNSALMTAYSSLPFEEARSDRAYWGRVVESGVGAHILNTTTRPIGELFYWRERGHEVDYVLRDRGAILGVEVKSGSSTGDLSGLEAFGATFHRSRKLIIGGSGWSLPDALSLPASQWLERGLA